MLKLISKIQLKNCEKGEFISENYRNKEELLTLYKDFKWDEQRKKLQVDYTNPSITINDYYGNYLKIALYYNNKYVIRFLDLENKSLYLKAISNLEESYCYINDIYNQKRININDFKKERKNVDKIYQHFITENFEYSFSTTKGLKYLLSNSFMNFLFGIFLIAMYFFIDSNESLLGFLTLGFLFIIMGGGINLFLYWKFYNFSKYKYLKISKANNIFYYGNLKNYIEYNKENINHCDVIRNDAPRSPIYDFIIFRIYFNDETLIEIPNLIINEHLFLNKLDKEKIVYKNRYPLFKTK